MVIAMPTASGGERAKRAHASAVEQCDKDQVADSEREILIFYEQEGNNGGNRCRWTCFNSLLARGDVAIILNQKNATAKAIRDLAGVVGISNVIMVTPCPTTSDVKRRTDVSPRCRVGSPVHPRERDRRKGDTGWNGETVVRAPGRGICRLVGRWSEGNRRSSPDRLICRSEGLADRPTK